MIQYSNGTPSAVSNSLEVLMDPQDNGWLTDFLRQTTAKELSESAFFQLLLKHFRRLPTDQQKEIVGGSAKEKPRLPMEILPVLRRHQIRSK